MQGSLSAPEGGKSSSVYQETSPCSSQISSGFTGRRRNHLQLVRSVVNSTAVNTSHLVWPWDTPAVTWLLIAGVKTRGTCRCRRRGLCELRHSCEWLPVFAVEWTLYFCSHCKLCLQICETPQSRVDMLMESTTATRGHSWTWGHSQQTLFCSAQDWDCAWPQGSLIQKASGL